MAQNIELPFESCSNDLLTCPVVSKVVERDLFDEQIQDLDEEALKRREMYWHIMGACAVGHCPGQAPELAEQKARRNQKKEK